VSYILDALKKSEKERSLGSVPTLGAAEHFQERSVPLRWFLLTVICLMVAILSGGAWVLWSSRPGPQPVAGFDAASVLPATAPSAEEAQTRRTSAGEATVIPADPVPIAKVDDSIRARIPEVEINVLSYSEDVSKRFVMIGQNIFKEGEEVVEGLVILEIRNTEVIFGFDGIKFIMEP
jgi:general secretion pathway protein B